MTTDIEAAAAAFAAAASAFGVTLGPRRLTLAEARRLAGPTVPATDELLDFWAVATPTEVSVPFAPERLRLFAPSDVAPADRQALGPSWDDAWVLVGEIAGDPVIADTSRTGSPIMLAIHGTGTWSPSTVASGAAEFLLAVAAWLRTLNAFDGERLDEDRDFEVKLGFDDHLRAELGSVLSAEHTDALLRYLNT